MRAPAFRRRSMRNPRALGGVCLRDYILRPRHNKLVKKTQLVRKQMAIRQQVPRQSLQGEDRLRPFLLSNVTTTGKQLGGGSYGVVEELEMDGLVCAGKKIYDVLINPQNLGAQRLVDRYYSECSLLSELRHPHIVQFLGICFLPDSQLPVLVMERLQGSLDELLETTPDIPLSTKLSVLQDVARGLVFLHNRSPAVIHRDLTARNVLLDAGMTAKIADLGNSRIATIRPGQLAQTMTQGIPGTLVYMPPEALGSTQRYGPPLDISHSATSPSFLLSRSSLKTCILQHLLILKLMKSKVAPNFSEERCILQH